MASKLPTARGISTLLGKAERDALAVAQERSLTVLASLAAAIGKGNVALARMIADDDLERVLDDLGVAADAEIDRRTRRG